MKEVIILVNENESELVEKVKKVNGSFTEFKDKNFDGDITWLAFLIAITPAVINQLGEIAKTIIQNPSKGKIKINGIEIEGFSYDETMTILEKLSDIE